MHQSNVSKRKADNYTMFLNIPGFPKWKSVSNKLNNYKKYLTLHKLKWPKKEKKNWTF